MNPNSIPYTFMFPENRRAWLPLACVDLMTNGTFFFDLDDFINGAMLP